MREWYPGGPEASGWPFLPTDVAANLRWLLVVGTATERLMFRAYISEDGIILDGDDDLKEAFGHDP